jgi:wyosine [tRNA(Phe)-imidazoG37] synthetase (radical SAM superfamily)
MGDFSSMKQPKTLVHPDDTPSLVFADRHGIIKDFPDLKMAGRNGELFERPEKEDLIHLPDGSELFVLPDRIPLGIDPQTDELLLLDHDPEKPAEKINAVAAFMAPANTSIHSAAYQSSRQNLSPLPLFAYTAVGWHNGTFWVSAFRSDADRRQDADQFNLNRIRKKTQQKLKAHPDNRLIQHLGKCCLLYSCPAAKNYFLGRWEAPLPSSPACNARCVGCISLQPSGCCPSTQERITFTPTPAEIAEIAVPHLQNAAKPVVSFGQGCEGEPLLQAKTLETAIRRVRSKTNQGTINLNTNASLPSKVNSLARAGLDSIRVSLNSARAEYHDRYYRPNDFSLQDVCDSISIMKDKQRFVSLNYFILPGFTDDPDEFGALCELIENRRPDMIQLRNLNMDPEWYLRTMKHQPKKRPLGIRHWHRQLKQLFPWLRFGYFNPALR